MAHYRHCFVCLLLLASVSVVTPAVGQAPVDAESDRLDVQPALERARIYYESARYGACVDAFTRLIARSLDELSEQERASARIYLGACLIAQGKREEARQQFRQAILEERQLEPPDPVVFPQAVIDVFVEVRSTLMEALRRQQEEDIERRRREAREQLARQEHERRRVAELERLAALETVVRRNERWMAWVPFGLGQFHNGDEALGWIFLATEGALALSAITATSIELGLHAQAEGGRAPLDVADLNDKIELAHRVGTISWLSLVGVAVLGVIEANLSFRPEVPVGQRQRPLPDSLRPMEPLPSGARLDAPTFGGAWFNIRGRF